MTIRNALDVRLGSSVADDETVAVHVTKDPIDGSPHAVLVPRAIKGASPELMLMYSDLQHTAGQIQDLLDGIYETVADVRAAGGSWNSIAWCLGVSPQAAAKRFGPEREDD